MTEDRVILGAYWRERRITAKEFIKLSYEFLSRLRTISDPLDKWCVAIKEGSAIIPALVPDDYPAFEQLMMKAVPDHENIYINPDPEDKNFTLDSTFTLGFRISFSDPEDGTIPPTHLSASIRAGAYGEGNARTNSVLIDIAPEQREFWGNKQKAKQLMELVVSMWQPSFATLTSWELRKALDPERTVNFALGPLTYFADEKAGDLASGIASVEPAVDGGVFLSMDAPYPWASAIDRFKPYHAKLNNAGLLQWPHKGRAVDDRS